MQISALPSAYKSTSLFSRPAHIKSDTHHVYSTEKYVVEIVFHSSIFYAPEFYKVSVTNKAGEKIWSGGDSIFLDSLFKSDFVSDSFDRMVLTRVNANDSPGHMQIVVVDLKTGTEQTLTGEGHYYTAGHFISFDCVYYSDKNGIQCIDYENGSRFMLHDVLKQHFTEIETWGSCPVKDCMLVITRETENNVYLFNLFKQRIEDRATLRWGKADAVHVTVGYAQQQKGTVLTVSYANKDENGILSHATTKSFNLEFE